MGLAVLILCKPKKVSKYQVVFYIYKRSLNVLGPEYMYLKLALKTV